MNKYKKLRYAILSTCFLIAQANADSSFDEVEKVIYGPPPAPQSVIEKQEQAVYQNNQLPHYKVVRSKFIQAGIDKLLLDSQRTLSSNEDYYPRIEKLVHNNGICFSGKWTITESTPYTGYFKQGATGLLIARASTALSETERGQPRAFGLAGKIFPTLNPTQQVSTANFFAVDKLMGAQIDHYIDVKMTNKPEIGFRFGPIPIGIAASQTFIKADQNPLFRPLYPISELGLAAGEIAKTPTYMMIQASAGSLPNDQKDFRDELNIEKNNSGALLFDILVSDKTSNKKATAAWNKIGYIELTKSKVSYGCDRQLHFHHPKIK